MSIEGTIQNGQVVLPAPAPLPDGTPVRVEPVPGQAIDPEAYPYSKAENLLGVGEDWWSDEEFDRFQKWLRESRQRGG